MVSPGDDLAELIIDSVARGGLDLVGGDVLVVAQKVISKIEGRHIDLVTVKPTHEANVLAAEVQKDPRFVQAVLSESRRIVRSRPNVLIVEHRNGYIMANAGIDRSNVAPEEGRELLLLLPLDADASAKALRTELERRTGLDFGVIVSDSFGRPWRRGTTGVALGAAGLPALKDMRGQPDLFGRALQTTEIGLADEVASAASLLMGQAGEGRPVVVVRGLDLSAPPRPARDLIRPESEDLFR